jgi:hypothetical protein
MADLFQQDRITEGCADITGIAQPHNECGEVGVAAALDRLLQRIGVHRQRVGAHPVERFDQVGHGRLGQL